MSHPTIRNLENSIIDGRKGSKVKGTKKIDAQKSGMETSIKINSILRKKDEKPLEFTILPVGNMSAGKTSLINRYIHNEFLSSRSIENALTEEKITNIMIGKNQIKLRIGDTGTFFYLFVL